MKFRECRADLPLLGKSDGIQYLARTVSHHLPRSHEAESRSFSVILCLLISVVVAASVQRNGGGKSGNDNLDFGSLLQNLLSQLLSAVEYFVKLVNGGGRQQ